MRSFRRRVAKAECAGCGGQFDSDSLIHDSEIDDIAFACLVHFGELRMEQYTCRKCADFTSKVCEGKSLTGMGCWRCMVDKVRSGEIALDGSFSF